MSTATIESALRDLQGLPVPVRSWRVETGPDATDDDAVWVWATLNDEDLTASTCARVRELVRSTLQELLDGGNWIYVRFRGASETPES